MDTQPKRYRGFISYSQRDKPIAQRMHRALETYHLPKGIDAPVGPNRTLGRFFRDDDEMGASQSLGAALEGALDDADSLIVICTPASAKSKWVDAEVRRFKRRGSARVFAVIASGEPNSADPSRECFPPSLKVKIDTEGNPTGEPDEPRAPDLQREGMQRVRVQLAAGLLDISFDTLWRRDRRRARRTRLLASAAGLLVVTVLAVVGYGWLVARVQSRTQAARQAVALSRSAAADGRITEALTRLTPFLSHRDTNELVENPLRAMLGWITDPYVSIKRPGLIPARLRDATVLLDPGRGVWDVSDVGLDLQRLIRSQDGQRLVAIGDQKVVVFDVKTGQRLSQIANNRVQWMGHGFETPSGLIVVTGAVLGPTNGSVVPYVLSISADGKTTQPRALQAPVFFGSAVGVTPKCDALIVAIESEQKDWRVESYGFDAGGLGKSTESTPLQPAAGDSTDPGVDALTPFGQGFQTRDAFLGEAKQNPFTASGCSALALDEGFAAGTTTSKGVPVVTLEPSLSFETNDHWTVAATNGKQATSTYSPTCTEAQPCPIVGGRKGEPFVRDDMPITDADEVGPPPTARWSRKTASPGEPIYFDHRVFNSGHRLVICRPRDGKDVCLLVTELGEDQLQLPFLRSPGGRFLFWPFGGSVYDLETLQPLTASRAIPTTKGMHFDFEIDRPSLTVAVDGRLVSFIADPANGVWTRSDEERASPAFSVLLGEGSKQSLHTLASLGSRHYLAVRDDGVVARLDAATGQEVWRVSAGGLGDIQDVQLNPERKHLLVMGKTAWRVFRLADGFPLSGFLTPPPALGQPAQISNCRLQGVLGPDGDFVVSCVEGAFAWRPRTFTGDLGPQLARLTCAADLRTSALDTIRRCYVTP
jgi:hypothetical protein